MVCLGPDSRAFSVENCARVGAICLRSIDVCGRRFYFDNIVRRENAKFARCRAAPCGCSNLGALRFLASVGRRPILGEWIDSRFRSAYPEPIHFLKGGIAMAKYGQSAKKEVGKAIS
jgi:hypothetical protein